MSHKATNWLSSLDAKMLGNSEFRILFHLCDCHNPSNGCFPTQRYLRDVTGVSNGTLNNALASLEGKGLIERHVSFEKGTHRKRPTRYMLGFEKPKTEKPSPKTGDGNQADASAANRQSQLQSTGDGAISKKTQKPSPKNGKSHLQPVGDKPVNKPVIKPACTREAEIQASKASEAAKYWATEIHKSGTVPGSAISIGLAEEMLHFELVTKEQLRTANVTF